MQEVLIQKPFLKWVGGKTQLIEKIFNKLPKEMNNYHELFLGGGSVLLAVLSLQNHGKLVIKNKIYAYDYNESLINVYNHIKNNRDELFEAINRIVSVYDKLDGTHINRKPSTEQDAMSSKESYYYWLRMKYNSIDKHLIEHSALFMFLNKTCFRGMYREGPNGFNVPYGHYKTTPVIIKKHDLDTISEMFQHVEFIHSDFRDSINRISSDDFVYLDPPYAPENAKSFVGYTADGFSLEMHKTLFSEIKKNKNAKFLLSNACVDLVTESFQDYIIEEVTARRAINAKKPSSTTREVLICNY
tara:strand:- start:232 stop:1134 length:903 start_codon:yes stop_codon:yes gene_type:complete